LFFSFEGVSTPKHHRRGVRFRIFEEELGEMPSCNLAETIHNKWLQASGNNGGDLYVATVDDFVRGFLQVVNYYQFLKGDLGGIGPTKKELKLRMAERRAKQTSNPLVLEDPMLDMPRAEVFCTVFLTRLEKRYSGPRCGRQICLLELKRSLIGLTRLTSHIQEVQDVM
jgi:hypothetical protein